MPDDRFGTLKFDTCAHAVLAQCGDDNVVIEYCCSQPDVMKSGKYYPLTIKVRYEDRYIEAVRLGAASDDMVPLDVSWEQRKKQEERIENRLVPCVECQFYEMKKEDLYKKKN